MSDSASLLVIQDSELVEKAQSGDTDAFSELVRRYQIEIRGFLRRRLSDVATADDLAQEVFLGAMKSIAGFRSSSSVRSWLFSIARYKLIDHIRSESRAGKLRSELESTLAAESLRRTENEEETDESTLRSLQECMKKLHPKARDMLHEFYFDNIGAIKIARKNNQKPSTVRMSLLRIRKALGKCIKKTLGDAFRL